jgi:MFS family permease
VPHGLSIFEPAQDSGVRDARWTLPSEVLSPAVAGVGIGLINGAGNLGGTVGPWFFGFMRDRTGNFHSALTIGGLSMIVATLIAIPIRTDRHLPDSKQSHDPRLDESNRQNLRQRRDKAPQQGA